MHVLLFPLTWSLELSRKRKKTVKSFFYKMSLEQKKFKACPLSVGQNTALERLHKDFAGGIPV